jgi:hypothetical protein
MHSSPDPLSKSFLSKQHRPGIPFLREPGAVLFPIPGPDYVANLTQIPVFTQF